uniref:Secreted peptide n=1 Tax=Anopheles coluzzii TaxID=1518534 RepID=A0A8W7PM02_ANOCL
MIARPFTFLSLTIPITVPLVLTLPIPSTIPFPISARRFSITVAFARIAALAIVGIAHVTTARSSRTHAGRHTFRSIVIHQVRIVLSLVQFRPVRLTQIARIHRIVVALLLPRRVSIRAGRCSTAEIV